MLNDNRQVTSLAPHGLSGSPVWLVLDRVNENDPSRTPLIGVVIEYDPRKKFVKACDIGFGLALIEQFENAV